MTRATLLDVFNEIEEKTEFTFFYKNEDVDLQRKVTIKTKKKTIKQILTVLFESGDITYEILDKQIVLKNRVPLPPPETASYGIQQQVRITGIVTDATGKPLPGVAVVLKGTKNGVATDFDGNYSITVPDPESVLVFTSMGFDAKEITVGNRQVINVTLQEAVSELDEVVVSTGYWKEKRRLSTGNISKIDSKVIERQPVTNPLEALQGQVAGVSIQQTSGTPGSAININIRGLNSLNNGLDGRPNANLPFIVIDGVPFPSSSLDTGPLSNVAGLSGGHPLSAMQPSDIESIEILKDADATAIYGSRGANGVILITTKKGKPGKTRYTLDYSRGIGEVANRVDVLNTEQYLAMRHEAIRNDGRLLTSQDSTSLIDLFLWDPNRDVN